MTIISFSKVDIIRKKYDAIESSLNEKSRRRWAASEAKWYGWGGIKAVEEATGITDKTIRKGLREIKNKIAYDDESARLRKSGGGRKSLTRKNPQITDDLESLLESATAGHPESPLKWTSKSSYHLAEELRKKHHVISQRSVVSLLKKNNYSLQGNRKMIEGSGHPDRNAQFEHINAKVTVFLEKHEPVISVDTKKKENIGNFKNNGKEYRKKGDPIKVNGHDFPDKDLGKASPYGIYDIGQNKGWMNVGISHDTAEFSVESIRQWWINMGKRLYPKATSILITADGGGSNSSRGRLWKMELQKFANESKLEINVCHFPPGTSKWNKIEHKMFSFVSINWRGRPLMTLQTIISLIANTKTKKGLEIEARLDTRIYQKGIKINDRDFAKLCIQKDPFHGDWNYCISPENHLQ